MPPRKRNFVRGFLEDMKYAIERLKPPKQQGEHPATGSQFRLGFRFYQAMKTGALTPMTLRC